MESILVVEDDATIYQPLLEFLGRHSFHATHAATLREATLAMAQKPEAIVLDWALPDGDGLQWLRALRDSRCHTPVIMLTARADLVDKVVGLESGANDYLVKPFEPRELVARLRAQLRSQQITTDREIDDHLLQSSGITLNTATLEVTWQETLVELTPMEFKLLRYFLQHPKQALSREAILNTVWGLRYPSTRTVDVHVMQLRQKFRADLFQTLHGTGYRFAPDGDK